MSVPIALVTNIFLAWFLATLPNIVTIFGTVSYYLAKHCHWFRIVTVFGMIFFYLTFAMVLALFVLQFFGTEFGTIFNMTFSLAFNMVLPFLEKLNLYKIDSNKLYTVFHINL